MDLAKLEAKLDLIGDQVDKGITKANELAKNSAAEEGNKVKAELKAEIAANVDKYNTMQGTLDAMKEQLNAVDVATQKNQGQPKTKSFGNYLKDTLKEDVNFKAFKEKQNSGALITLKDFGLLQKADMVSGTNYVDATGVAVVPPTRVNGVFYSPDRATHIRQILPVGTTNSNKIEYLQETAITDNTASTSEGALFGQSEVTVTAVKSDVEKIGTRLDFTVEMLEDWDAFTSYISVRFAKKLMLKEDQQLLYGSGSSPQLQGISGVASAFAPYDTTLGSAAQVVDILNQAVSQATIAEYRPNYILLNPADYYNILALKDSQNNYIWGTAILVAGALQIAGVPVIPTTAVAADDFFVGDFNMGCQLFDRKMPEIEFSYENGDNFEKDLVSAKIRERVAFIIPRTDAFIYGDITTAIANYSG